MRIAQVAPLFLRVPPLKYGSIERIISYLTEEFTHQGHEVTLFASGDSVTNARLISPIPAPLTGKGMSWTRIEMAYAMQMELVLKHSDQFDVIHYHDRSHFPFSKRQKIAHLTTLHDALDEPEYLRFHNEFPDTPLVSVSDAQRQQTPGLNWRATVHTGLPKDLYRN
jgi:glycosyltransferase involved in cell wall biosynthesis